ncbi:MAG: hypothetical protein INQ03_12110 [Candidatus Heimdallarchaeota archaeon]|nr:hypothetical protein [Candidatus Heimdallarchaeota archaeon]
MAENELDVIIKVIQILVILFIEIILVQRSRKYQMKALRWFIWSFFFAFIHGIIELVIYYLKIYVFTIAEPSYFKFNEYHSIPYSIGIFLLYILAESIVGYQRNQFRIFFAVSIWSSYITMLLYESLSTPGLVYTEPATSKLSNTLFDIFQIFTMGFFTYVFMLSHNKTRNDTHRKGTLTLVISSSIYVISIIYELGEDLLNFPNVYGAITLGISLLVLAFMFIRYPYFVFSVPTEIYRIILTSNFHKSLVYSAGLLNPEKESKSSVLVASGISAIAEFMKDSTGSNESLQYAYLGDRALMMVKGKLVSGIIIAENSTYILRSALKQLVREFETRYEKQIESFNANISQFYESRDIIARTFPFIESKETISLFIEKGEKMDFSENID